MKIIGSYVSPYVRKVLACMALKGIDDYEIDPITPFFGGEEFSRLSRCAGSRCWSTAIWCSTIPP